MMKRSRRNPRPLMSVMEYARHLGVDHAGISRAIARGDIVPLDNGLIDVEQANATYGRRRAQRAALRASNAETAEKCERAALTKTIAKVRKARRLARQLNDTSVPREQPQTAIGEIIEGADRLLRTMRRKGLARGYLASVIEDLGSLETEALRVFASSLEPPR
jgi:hypothetical protein